MAEYKKPLGPEVVSPKKAQIQTLQVGKAEVGTKTASSPALSGGDSSTLKGISTIIDLKHHTYRLDEAQLQRLERTLLFGLIVAGRLAAGKEPSATKPNLQKLVDYVEGVINVMRESENAPPASL